jgi:hypothetical protein
MRLLHGWKPTVPWSLDLSWTGYISCLCRRAGRHEVKVDMDFAIAKGITEDLLAELRGQTSKEEGRGLVGWRGFVDGTLDSGKGRDGRRG